ncbi:MAG: glutaminyl-peptide cyclotransferase, partial [Luteolibacter sp.]
KNGNVTGVLELSELRKQLTDKKDAAEVLNGIAHHPETGHLWVTGKNWSEMFEIKLK